MNYRCMGLVGSFCDICGHWNGKQHSWGDILSLEGIANIYLCENRERGLKGYELQGVFFDWSRPEKF